MKNKNQPPKYPFVLKREAKSCGYINVRRKDFSIEHEIERLQGGDDETGAIASFTGFVRSYTKHPNDINYEKTRLKSIHLEHYKGMTERMLTEFRAEAIMRFNLNGATIIHRIGRLYPKEQIVLVLTSAKHRGDAFAACEFLMDWLKTEAPFWKSEETVKNETLFVAAKNSDQEALARWNEHPS